MQGLKINFGDLTTYLTYDAKAPGFVNEVESSYIDSRDHVQGE
jgi:hypothetical protein